MPVAESLSCWEESANEAKVRVLISINSNPLSEQELQFWSLLTVKSLTHTHCLINVCAGLRKPFERVWISQHKALPPPRAKTWNTSCWYLHNLCECLWRRQHTAATWTNSQKLNISNKVLLIFKKSPIWQKSLSVVGLVPYFICIKHYHVIYT